MATALELYCTGSLNLFNHPTNVDLNSPCGLHRPERAGENLRKIAMHITNDFVTSAVNANFQPRAWLHGATLTSSISCSVIR